MRGRKVLVVDDDVRNIFALNSLLERHNMHVISASNGQDAIRQIESDAGLSLVLMDIMMPEMDGYETMRRIRSDRPFPSAADYRADRQGHERRPREMPRGRGIRLRRQAGQHRPIIVAGADVAAPMKVDGAVNILLVDDQPGRLLSYEAILKELGQNLVTARSGLEALERLMQDEYAVVLLDVSMPGMDGFETASLIHEHPRFERTPIIFVTGVHINELDRMKAYKLGAVDYVLIPVVPEILRSKVAVLVELHQQRRELQQLNSTLAQANAQLSAAHLNLQAEKTRELENLNASLREAVTGLEAANRALHGEILERARVEQQLKEADRLKDEFLAMLAHELRNPLAPIHNAVRIMRMKPVGDTQVEWARDVIDRQAAHLTRLVDDLLDVSRITRGKINIDAKPLDLAAAVARAVETVQPMLMQQKHELQIELPATPLSVMGDLTRVTQIIGNVLGNAVKYTDAGGRIHLSARLDDGMVEIRIRDNGIGIPASMLPTVFDLFSQAGIRTAALGWTGHWPGAGQTAGGDARRQRQRAQRRGRTRH